MKNLKKYKWQKFKKMQKISTLRPHYFQTAQPIFKIFTVLYYTFHVLSKMAPKTPFPNKKFLAPKMR